MNRLTKKIGLVLISSSLLLAGCSSHDDDPDAGGDAGWGKDSGTGQGASGGYRSGGYRSHFPFFFGGTHFSGGGRTGTSSFSSHSGSTFGGSSRGGFGASAHGGG